MKKIISIALALVMMMAICVPAFAEVVNTDGVAGNTTNVETSYTEETDTSYTVTIPATISIPWGNTNPQNATYTVESQLLIGAKLNVSATSNNNGAMTATGTNDELEFTVTGGDVVTFDAVNAEKTTAPGVTEGENVKVAISSFDGKAVGEYTGTITYTVEYVAPTTTP